MNFEKIPYIEYGQFIDPKNISFLTFQNLGAAL